MRWCFWILLLTHYLEVSKCDDVPCVERQTQFGAVCVCNSSYCDTVERPPPLTGGRYYHYTTSSDSPGFHRTTGYFKLTLNNNIRANNESVVFTVNPNIRYQEIIGFGGSFTDAAGISIDSLQPQVKARLVESYFGPDGIEYSLGRVGVGMTDFSTRYYTYNDFQNDEEMVNFTLVDEDYKYKIPLIQEAMEASPHKLKLIGCSFTSPSWIQTINGAYHSGYISRNHFHAWAKYHVKFLDNYAAHNISFWAFTGGNQVSTIYLYGRYLPLEFAAMPYDHMVWLRDHLAPQLAASNHSDVKFLIMDDMRLYAKFWMSRFARDPAAFNLIAGVAIHWYFDYFTNVTIADDVHHNYPDKLIMYTETSVNIIFGGQPMELGSWPRAALYAYNIIENLNHWTSGYLDWNLALDIDGGPSLYWILDAAIITNTTNGEFYKNPMFYAMGHFSKFIPPGSRRVDVKYNQQEEPMIQGIGIRNKMLKHFYNKNVVEDNFKEERDENVTTVAPKTTTYPFKTPILAPKTVSCVATVNSDNSSSVIVFNGMDSDVNVTIEDTVSGYITATLTANSLNTFVYWPGKS